MAIKIYLAGPIPKGDDVRQGWKDWKTEYREKLERVAGVRLMDGDAWRDETRPFEAVGHDSYLIKTADVVVVHCAGKLGAGTAQEMVIAKYFARPVVSVLPRDTHHRRSNIVFDNTKIEDWIHPFVLTFSDVVVEEVGECAAWLEKFVQNPGGVRVKNIGVVDEAIRAYLDKDF